MFAKWFAAGTLMFMLGACAPAGCGSISNRARLPTAAPRPRARRFHRKLPPPIHPAGARRLKCARRGRQQRANPAAHGSVARRRLPRDQGARHAAQ